MSRNTEKQERAQRAQRFLIDMAAESPKWLLVHIRSTSSGRAYKLIAGANGASLTYAVAQAFGLRYLKDGSVLFSGGGYSPVYLLTSKLQGLGISPKIERVEGW